MRCNLLLMLMLLLLASCRQKEEPERTYDLSQSRALLATGEQMLDEATAGTAIPPETLAQLEETSEGRRLADALREHRAQHELMAEANRLLVAERYNDLAVLLERAQREGLATSQLLELAGLPQALQALRLYCARRPFEHAADLEQNLEFLRPWLRQLQELSPAFQIFLQEQQAQLMAMRQQEAVAAEEDILQQLDWLMANATQASHAGDYLAQAANDFPQLPILQYLQRSGDAWQPTGILRQQLDVPNGFLARASTRERLSLELAFALVWDALGEEAQGVLAQEWKNSTTTSSLTGTFLKAKCLKDITLFESAIATWQHKATQDELLNGSPAFLDDYLEALFPEAPSPSWSLAAPDFANSLGRLLECAR